MYLQESVQLIEHDVELVKVGLEDFAMVILVHDLYQDCKRLLFRHFLKEHTKCIDYVYMSLNFTPPL